MAQAVLRKYASLNTFNLTSLLVEIKTLKVFILKFLNLISFFFLYRVKKRSDLIGAFKLEPLYLQHHHQESGNFIIK